MINIKKHYKKAWYFRALERCSFLAALVFSFSAYADNMIDSLIMENASGYAQMHFDTNVTAERRVASNAPLLRPQTLTYIQNNIDKYAQIVARGGWSYVPDTAGPLRIGMRSANVIFLRYRLAASGDLIERGGVPDFFDSYLQAAVKRFQLRHGLPATGVVGQNTYNALNVSAEERLKQLRINYVRVRQWLQNVRGEPRFIMVNIPAAQIEAVDHGYVAQRHTAVVGKIDRQTPILHSKVIQIILNPFWVVPKSIIKKDIIPLMRNDPNYLKDSNIHVYDSKGKEIEPENMNWDTKDAVRFTFRQPPGKNNAMSSTKINFPNPYSVYMHDTPEQDVFNDLMRFDSSGCVRVHNVRDLDCWILKNTPGWTRNRIDSVIHSGKNTPIRVKDPVPLHFVYVTAWATSPDVVQFRDDIYKKDNLETAK